MIHLDTNYLIGLLVNGSPQAKDVGAWLDAGETLAASAIAWAEFLNGPVTTAEISRAEEVVQSRIIAFGHAEAAAAANLLNKTGRRRGSRFDCLIAATAVLRQAEVATLNDADFKAFVPYGLKLANRVCSTEP